jgi:hypothetical protein
MVALVPTQTRSGAAQRSFKRPDKHGNVGALAAAIGMHSKKGSSLYISHFEKGSSLYFAHFP